MNPVTSALRIGILGAAAIAPAALIRPARRLGTGPEGVRVTAIAARDRARAERFAARHGIDTVFGGYQELVESDAVDAVYIPLPNGLHGRWTLAAVAAGKHVLCEKPFTANAAEAATVASTVAAGDRVVMEAFHYRYHPLANRILELIGDGAIGPVRHVEAHMCLPLPRFSDIRYSLPLAGGALMDAGCYAVHALRTFGPGEPTVTAARAKTHGVGIDRLMTIDLRYDDGATGRIRTALWSAHLLELSLRITGETGAIRVFNFVAPQVYHRLSVRSNGRRFHERVPGKASYTMQLQAFRDAVRDGAPVLTDAADAVRTMAVIDAAYERAGLPIRQPTA
jgi:predicted dehydrogenase